MPDMETLYPSKYFDSDMAFSILHCLEGQYPGLRSSLLVSVCVILHQCLRWVLLLIERIIRVSCRGDECDTSSRYPSPAASIHPFVILHINILKHIITLWFLSYWIHKHFFMEFWIWKTWIKAQRRGKGNILNRSVLAWTRPRRGRIPPPLTRALPPSSSVKHTDAFKAGHNFPSVFCFSAVVSRLLDTTNANATSLEARREEDTELAHKT